MLPFPWAAPLTGSPVLPSWRPGTGLGPEVLPAGAQRPRLARAPTQPARQLLRDPTNPHRTHQARAPRHLRSWPQYSPPRGSQGQVLAEGVSPASQGEGVRLGMGCPRPSTVLPAPVRCPGPDTGLFMARWINAQRNRQWESEPTCCKSSEGPRSAWLPAAPCAVPLGASCLLTSGQGIVFSAAFGRQRIRSTKMMLKPT